MSVEVKNLDGGKMLEIHLTGKLVQEDYEALVPAIERLTREQGKIDMLVVMHDFHGWTAGALWEDTKFAMHHFRDVGRLAMIGETNWQAGMATFCKPFTGAKVRYFDSREETAAREWLAEA